MVAPTLSLHQFRQAMINLNNTDTTSVGAKHFKSIGEESVSLSEIKPLNVIIGKNNSGKSTLLDVLDRFMDVEKRGATQPRDGEEPQFLVNQRITKSLLKKCFERSSNQARVPLGDGRTLTIRDLDSWTRERLEGQELVCIIGKTLRQGNQSVGYADIDNHNVRPNDLVVFEWLLKHFSTGVQNPFEGYEFRRVLADRDLIKEKGLSPVKGGDPEIEVESNGLGFTRTVVDICSRKGLDRDLIEVEMLSELNRVFRPDCNFTRVLVEQGPDELWEVVLEEPNKGRVRLSDMGSGVKTVLLVLMFLIVLPRQQKTDVSKTIFAFEELENNLHPAVQRRLFAYLRSFALENKTCIFLTTHSNLVVDMFSSDENAQLLHVTHDGTSSSMRKVECWKTGCDVLRDLDIRASDVLQSNGIVWVEGPSDRIYFSRWIELWTAGQLTEGVHYQCLPYGGSVGAHLSLANPDDIEELVSALKVNSNAMLLIDSDKNRLRQQLKETTKRLKNEIQASGGMAWVTKGKEVENYIPEEALKTHLPKMPTPGQFESVIDMIHKQPKKKSVTKVAVAMAVKELLTKEMLEGHLDMKDRLTEAAQRIAEWNRIELNQPNE